MPRPRETEHGPAWLVQATSIARSFYLEGRSKIEIADETGLSRFKVARILEEAREHGLVQVTVGLPGRINADLSAMVRDRYALERAIVVTCGQDSEAATRQDLGQVVAELLTELVTPETVLGMTCSRTVAVVTQALRALAPCRVVQLSGTLAGPDVETGSVESVRRAAAVGGGKAYPIYAPMLCPDSSTREALSGQSAIQQALCQFEEVTVALLAIGGWDGEVSTVWRTAEAADRRAVTAAGAVGEIAARPFDAAGRAVPTPLDDRVLGVTLDQLQAIPEVIGIGYDVRRAAAVRAVLTRGLVDTLVCDDQLARVLLEDEVETE